MSEATFYHSIDKYDVVTDILTVFDELEACRRELEATRRDLRDMERGIAACDDMGGEKPVNPTDVLCLRAGRRKIFEDCTYSWHVVKATRNEETGAIEVTTFDKFRASIFNRCPDSMSKREFFEYFDSEFRERYDEEKDKAIADLEANEADDD